jgi:hypothetical protein
MKSKTTLLWFVLAAALFAGIWILERHLQPPPPVVNRLLPGLQASAVTGMQISPNGAYEISVLRTNGGWQLERPLAYPAQATAIETLLTTLEKLTPLPLTADEMRGHSDSEYGLDNPQFRVVVTAGDRQWQFQVGSRTAPGDQVFVRVVGANGAWVADAAWLSLLPRAAADWRDTALVPASGAYDWIVITNGTKVIELRRDTTNHLWRMIQPLVNARVDGPRLATALQQLQSARAEKFVTDDPKADLTAFRPAARRTGRVPGPSGPISPPSSTPGKSPRTRRVRFMSAATIGTPFLPPPRATWRRGMAWSMISATRTCWNSPRPSRKLK